MPQTVKSVLRKSIYTLEDLYYLDKIESHRIMEVVDDLEAVLRELEAGDWHG